MNIHRYKMNKPQGFGIDERRFVTSAHRKGREERKAEQHKSLYLEEIIRPGTRMTRIKRIYTDHHIRAHPRQPLRRLMSPACMALGICGDPCSILFKDSNAINNELVRTETNSCYSKFGG